jgi:hypothetical protein
MGTLPFVDEHRVSVSAPALVVWRELGESLRRPARAGGVGARMLHVDPERAQGDPLVEGSTIPGFGVREAVPGQRLVLAGRHRFSDYTLTFTLVDDNGATRLAARTYAAFPGLGRIYRALVIGSGGHRVIVRRWLERIRRASETDTA